MRRERPRADEGVVSWTELAAAAPSASRTDEEGLGLELGLRLRLRLGRGTAKTPLASQASRPLMAAMRKLLAAAAQRVRRKPKLSTRTSAVSSVPLMAPSTLAR